MNNENEIEYTPILIVGASFAGLACAAHLQNKDLQYKIIDENNKIGEKWQNHYDDLKLHTNAFNFGLPFLDFNATQKYADKNSIVTYLLNYCDKLNLNVTLNTKVSAIEKLNDKWQISTDSKIYHCQYLIVCTGKFNTPQTLHVKGEETFTGKLIHSSAFKNAESYNNKNVLIIGFGNSGSEIALQLTKNKNVKSIYLSVKPQINIIPRTFLGISFLTIVAAINKIFSRKIATLFFQNLFSLMYSKTFNKDMFLVNQNFLISFIDNKKIPVIDTGIVKAIKQQKVILVSEVDQINNKKIKLKNDQYIEVDHIILATGYTHNLQNLFKTDMDSFIQKMNIEPKKQKKFGAEQVYFAGFYSSPLGNKKLLNKESELIISDIINRLSKN